MPTWQHRAVDGIDLVIDEIDRLERELVPVLFELLRALQGAGADGADQLAALSGRVVRLRAGLGAAERSVARVQVAMQAGQRSAN